MCDYIIMTFSENKGESKEIVDKQEEDIEGEEVDKVNVKEESKDRKISFSIFAFFIALILLCVFAILVFITALLRLNDAYKILKSNNL